LQRGGELHCCGAREVRYGKRDAVVGGHVGYACGWKRDEGECLGVAQYLKERDVFVVSRERRKKEKEKVREQVAKSAKSRSILKFFFQNYEFGYFVESLQRAQCHL
jgi:hypothetical protein